MSARERILAAAMELFARKGFDRTTVDEIVNKAGIAKGTFYIYFKSKEDLIKEIALEVVPSLPLSSISEPFTSIQYPDLGSFLEYIGRELIRFYTKEHRGELLLHVLASRKRYPSIDSIYCSSYIDVLREGSRRILAYTKIGLEKAVIVFHIFLSTLINYVVMKDCLNLDDEIFLKNTVDSILRVLSASLRVG